MTHRCLATGQRGFTLIELMSVMAIVAVLAAIAYPSYMDYAHRAKRTDAMSTMTFMAQQLERCYSQNFSYAGCVQVPAGAAASKNNYYTITVAVGALGATYSLTAVPNGAPQNGDKDCQSFTMTSGGAQTAANGGGADTTTTCWGTK